MLKISVFCALAFVAGMQAAHAGPRSAVQCTADHLSQRVTPTHVPDSWPQAAKLPAQFDNTLGVRFALPGKVADGFLYRLYVDSVHREVYVTQEGGFAGTTRVYGPLPLAHCTASAEPSEQSLKRAVGNDAPLTSAMHAAHVAFR